MSAHTLSVRLWIPVETLHSALATITAMVISCLHHIGRGGPWGEGHIHLYVYVI